MNKLLGAVVLAFAGASLCAVAAENPQQNKMADCNKEASAKNLKGDDRQSFMSKCLSAKKEMTQQEKMAACNKDAGAKNMKGDDRKKFMKECLSA